MKVRVTSDMLALFAKHRFFSAPHSAPRFAIGNVLEVPEDAVIEDYANVFTGEDLPRRIGAFTYSHAWLNQLHSIGRYCSIASYCGIMGSAHPAEWVSTSPFSHHPQPVSSFAAYLMDRGGKRFNVLHFERGDQNVTIGNDVWLGEMALLKRGITIGDGAIVAARAIVTHDVPPYAIVAGTPARVLRFRFPEAIVKRLLRSEWWRFGPDQVQQFDVREPEAFLDRFDQAVADGLLPPQVGYFTGAEIIAAGEVVA